MPRTTRPEQLRQVQDWISTGVARQLREDAGLSLSTSASACGGVDRSAILRWERGQRVPRGRNLSAYYRFLRGLAARQADRGLIAPDEAGVAS